MTDTLPSRGRVALETLFAWLDAPPVRLRLDPDGVSRLEAARRVVERHAAGERPVYGINTGFGKLARVRIAPDRTRELQRRLVLSHMCGVGPPFDADTVRLTLLLLAASLARGYSGVRPMVVERLLDLLRHDCLPVVPQQGSVGASGDLAPLAHVAGLLIGVGEADLAGERLPAAEALRRFGLEPLVLEAKEGLALLNGTHVSTACALLAWRKAMRLFDAALLAGAATTDAALGSDVPFDPRLARVRNQPGQGEVAARLAALLAGSGIRASHLECERVQDPYCLRCQPQVMGAAFDLLLEAGRTLEQEAGGVSDNPLVFVEEGAILAGGNFHAQPVAFAADRIALALAEAGSLAERRIAFLTDGSASELPPFLAAEPGLDSGFMVAQVVAAALASENKHLANPVSTDSIPTSAGQEDHVSMATWAARRLHPMCDNLARILAIELLAAMQGLEARRPLRSSTAIEALHAAIRRVHPPLDGDRPLAGEIEALAVRLLDGDLVREVAAATGGVAPGTLTVR